MVNDLTWNGVASLLTGWLFTYAVHSTLLLGGAWLLTRLFRNYAVAEILWKIALVGGLLTATAQTAFGIAPLLGHISLRCPGTFGPLTISASAGAVVALKGQPALMYYQRGSALPQGWPLGVLALWLLGVYFGLARWQIRRWRLETFLRHTRRRPIAGTPLALMLRRLCQSAGIRYRVHLTASARIVSPVALEGREICIPARALADLRPDQQEGMLAHELAHIARGDAGWRLIADLVKALFFFQPLNYLAHRNLQEIAEYLCDDWAVAQTGGHLSLAQCLAEVASWFQQCAQPLNAAGLTGKPSLLVSRVTRLVTHPDRRPARVSMFWGRLAAGLILLGMVALAPAVAIAVPIDLPIRLPFNANDVLMHRVVYIQTQDANQFFTQGVPIPVSPPDVPSPPTAPDP